MAIITITGDNNANVLTGTSATDQYNINGLGGNDNMHGNALNDTLDGGTGDDHMGGGAGNDVYIVDSVNDFVHEENGVVGGIDRIDSSVTFTLTDVDIENLTLTGVGNISGTGNAVANVINGNSGSNTLRGLGGNDTMHGFDGNDTLDGGTGDDHMGGGNGNDVFIVDSVNDFVHEENGLVGGVDRVDSSVTFTLTDVDIENLTLTGVGNISGTGNAVANVINGNSGSNTLRGLAGDDNMHGGDGNDLLDGGTNGVAGDHMGGGNGNDVFIVDSVNDFVHEENGLVGGVDRIDSSVTLTLTDVDIENLTLTGVGNINGTGNAVANVINGNSGSNTLRGLAGDDNMHGGDGNDLLDGGTNGVAGDHMGGGNGNDVFIVDSVNDFVHEENGLLGGVDRIDSSVTLTLTDVDVENLTLTGVGNISGTGNAVANVINGNSGNNTLNGMGGIDTMSGLAGNDSYFVDNVADQVIEGAGGGTDAIFASVTETLTDVDVENLFLTGAAVINGTGNASANLIVGNSAANVLMGMAGDDTITASGGNDTVQGGTGADTVRGGLGIDTLRAVDNVFGVDDLAEDRFVFDTALNAVTNVDLIDKASFTAGGAEGVDDQIWLENSIFTNLTSTAGTQLGELSAGMYFEGASTGNGAFDAVGIYNNTATGQLFYNATFGVAGDSILFAAVNLAGVAGGSAVLEAPEFTLV